MAKLIQPYRNPADRALPTTGRLDVGVEVFHVSHVYGHHHGSSGYDRLTDRVGRPVPLSRTTHLLGETLLRIPGVLTARYGGQYEHSRYDYVMETQVMKHLRRQRDTIFHFLYAEKGYRRSGKLNGHRGNALVGTFHYHPSRFEETFPFPDRLRRLERLVALGTEQADFLGGIVDPARVRFIPYATDPDVFTPPPTTPSGPARRCAYVGYHERDIDTLGRVIDGVLDQHADAEFVLVSRDPRLTPLVEAHPTRVRTCSGLSDAEYVALLQSCHVQVLPLRLAVANTAILEAMACGLPVITNRGGADDYVLPDGGVVCDVGDADAMIDATLGLLRDDDRLETARAGARRQALKFTWDRVSEQLAELYREIAVG